MAIQGQSWIAKNSLRSYPVRENSPMQSINTRWEVPMDVIVDCFIYVSSAPSGVMVSSISFTSKIVTITFADALTGSSLGYASAVVGVNTPYSSIPIIGIDPNCSGFCTFGEILSPDRKEYQESPGTHRLSPLDLLEPRCVMEMGDVPVSSFGSFGGSIGWVGNVPVIAGDSIKFTAVAGEESGEAITYVTVDLLNPENFLPICETKTETCGCPKTPVLSINGIAGPVTIEFEDELFAGVKAGESSVRLTLALPMSTTCEKNPPVPDSYGRLPKSFEKDCPPVTNYGIDPGPACIP